MLPKIENINSRSTRLEILDQKEFSKEELVPILSKIALVNQLLGGNNATIKELDKIVASNKSTKLKIVDLGCGGGDMCRAISKHFEKSRMNVQIIGVDINELSLEIAKEASVKYANVSYKNIDVYSDEFVQLTPDVIVCTLTLHHFKDNELIKALLNCLRIDNVTIIINDLHRTRLAYYLFLPVSYLLGMGYCNRHDGLLSILRGFKRKDLLTYSEEIQSINKDVLSSISWRWAFRYLWKLEKI